MKLESFIAIAFLTCIFKKMKNKKKKNKNVIIKKIKLIFLK